MKKYNMKDVTELEELYEKVKPWILSHPHMGLFVEGDGDEDVCSRCKSTALVRKGYAYTKVSKFRRYKCRDCGGWSRGKRAIARVDARGMN